MMLTKKACSYFSLILFICTLIITFNNLNATIKTSLLVNKSLVNPQYKTMKYGNWYIGIQGGYTRVFKPSDKSVATISSYPPDTFGYSKADGKPTIVINGGYQYDLKRVWFSRFGIGSSIQYGSSSFAGIISQFSFPTAQNYKYEYCTKHVGLLFNLSLGVLSTSRFSWFIDAGIGPAYVVASNYEQHFLIENQFQNLAFNDEHTWNIEYTAGTGLRFVLSKYWDLMIKYEYADIGEIHLAPGPVRPGVNGPDVHIKSNSVLLGLRFKL